MTNPFAATDESPEIDKLREQLGASEEYPKAAKAVAYGTAMWGILFGLIFLVGATFNLYSKHHAVWGTIMLLVTLASSITAACLYFNDKAVNFLNSYDDEKEI